MEIDDWELFASMSYGTYVQEQGFIGGGLGNSSVLFKNHFLFNTEQ